MYNEKELVDFISQIFGVECQDDEKRVENRKYQYTGLDKGKCTMSQSDVNKYCKDEQSILKNMLKSRRDVRESMNVNIKRNDEGYVIDARIPGYTKEEVDISYNNVSLTISAKHSETSEKEDEGHYIIKEFSSSDVSRTIPIYEADFAKAEASFNDGVLHLVIPNKGKPADSKIQIK